LPDRDPLTNQTVQDLHGISKKTPELPASKVTEQMRLNITNLPAEHDPRASRRYEAKSAEARCFIPDKKPKKYRLWCHTTYFQMFFDYRDLDEVKDWLL